MAMQEALLKQKAQIKWFEEGDSNTRYFHNVIKDRRRRLQLHRIKNSKGKWLHSDEKISNSAIRHFKRIFNLPGPAVDDNIFSCIPKIITDDDNIMLPKILIEEEIKDAIFDMSSTSSAGPDGFNGMFYQKCWEIIKVDVINFVQSFFYGNGLTKFYSHSCLALIPKVNSPSNFSELRPIRLITDNILLAQEIVHDIAKTNKGEWWTRAIWRLISQVWYSIIINGNRKGFFSSSQRLNQGDPLSPSLFILGSKVLSRLLNSLYEHPNFFPFTMSERGPQINHLAYADDIVIFSAGKSKVIKLIMKQIRAYERSSGQKVNDDKSFFCTHQKTSNSRINRIIDRTGFRHKQFPFNYLGCPLFVGRKKIEYFDDLVSRITRKLSGWSGKCLSYGGKVTLIKSVLQAIPTYTLAALTPPKDFVLAKYCTRVHPVAKSINAPQSPNRKKMMQIRDKIEGKILWQVREGNSNFWWDNWTGLGALAKICPNQSIYNKIKVKNYIEEGRWQADRLHDCIPSQLVQHILKVHIDNSNEEDYAVWESAVDGNFSTKNVWEEIREHKLEEFLTGQKIVRWAKPDTNKVKLNTDGSFSGNRAGIGGILRNSESNMVMAFAIPVDCNSSSMAKAYAVKHSMQWCLQNGSSNIVLELDSLMIVEMLQNKGTNNLKFKGIIEEIMSMINRMDCSIEQCYREANQAADGLAKYAAKRVDNHIFTNW
ncbi:uncharacterized protein LOC132631414 [Lycium barbarum]|uniref:uncharacterized protein LOC132631414 n=1 Tax=Lycium barbarum TaxID=112863 RepID=UPI00293F713B|nr:uncharacterized protein LOC132631414 [Lycium barbarum]